MTLKRLSLFLVLIAAFLVACSGDTAQDIENIAEQVGDAADQVADNADEIVAQAEDAVEQVAEAVVEVVEELACSDAIGCVEIAAGDPIKLASALVVTGPNESLGLDSQYGVEIAIADRGEMMGHEVVLQAEDDGCSAEGGQTAGQKIVSDPSIVGVVGTSCSGAGVPMSQIVCDAGVVMVSPSNTAPVLTGADTRQACYFRTAHNDKIQGAAMADFVYNELGITKAAAVHDGDPYTEGLATVFRDSFTELGGEIVAFEAEAADATNVEPLLTSVAAAGPELIYYPVFIPLGSLLTKTSQEIDGLDGVVLAAADGVLSPDFIEAAGSDSEGMYMSGPDLGFGNDIYTKFLATYEAEYGTEPTAPFHAHAYDATNMILDAIAAVAQVDADGNMLIGRQALIDAVGSTSGMAGITGTLTCDAHGDCADARIAVNQVQDGEFVPVASAADTMSSDTMMAEIPDLGGAELVVAIENAYPPFSFIDESTGDPIGYDYDIFVEMCSRMNCTPVFQETSWDSIVAVMGGDSDFASFDIGADGITITEERAEHVDFTRPYISLAQTLLVRVGEDRFTDADGLAADADLLIGSQPGTTNYDLSVELVGEDRIVAYDQFALAVAALIQGDVDAVTIDNVAGIGYVGQNPDKVMMFDKPLTAEDLGFILPKGSELTAGVSAVLDAMEADGTLDMLFAKWFATDEDEAGAEIPDLAGAELVIAIENAYPPFSFIDESTGDPIGYDYDIFAEICSRMNCTPVFQETSWDSIVAVMGGDSDFASFDIGADGITITEERAEHVDFTRPYISLAQTLLVRVGEDRFTDADGLAADADLLIGSQPGTTNYDLSVELVGEDRIVAYDQFALAVAALIQGDVDAVTIDNVAGIGYVGQNPDKVMMFDEPLTAEDLGFILPKGSELTAGVTTVLDAMEADGTLDALFAKWFVTDEE